MRVEDHKRLTLTRNSVNFMHFITYKTHFRCINQGEIGKEMQKMSTSELVGVNVDVRDDEDVIFA